MKTVGLYRFGIYIAYIFATTGCLLLPIGIFAQDVFDVVTSIVFIVLGVWLIRKYQSYKLILNRGSITEVIYGQQTTYHFRTLETLDCKIVDSGRSRAYYPIFIYTDPDGKTESLHLENEASLLDIVEWIDKEYPSAIKTERVEKFLRVTSGKFLRSLFRGVHSK